MCAQSPFVPYNVSFERWFHSVKKKKTLYSVLSTRYIVFCQNNTAISDLYAVPSLEHIFQHHGGIFRKEKYIPGEAADSLLLSSTFIKKSTFIKIDL